jgi:hypothetical protein
MALYQLSAARPLISWLLDYDWPTTDQHLLLMQRKE